MTETTASTSRRRPSQQRSQATVERILASALELVSEDGLSHFTTNAVAARAGINIATLYAYFPDKTAILRELIERYELSRSSLVTDRISRLSGDDWREWIAATITALAQARTQQPGGMALRRAVMGSPELRDIDDASTVRAAKAIAGELFSLQPLLGRARANRLGMLLTYTATEVLDQACLSGTIDHKLVRELTEMVTVYIEHCLANP